MPRDDNQLPMLLTVSEVAQILRTTNKAVYAMVERAAIPGITRLGRRVLVRSEDLLQWLDQNRAPSQHARTGHSARRT